MSVRIELDADQYEGYLLDGDFNSLFQMMNRIYEQKLCEATAQYLDQFDLIDLDEIQGNDQHFGSQFHFKEYIHQHNPIKQVIEQLQKDNENLEERMAEQQKISQGLEEEKNRLKESQVANQVENGMAQTEKVRIQGEFDQSLRDLLQMKLKQLCEDYAEKLIVSRKKDNYQVQLDYLNECERNVTKTIKSLPENTKKLVDQLVEVNQCPKLQTIISKHRCFNLKELFELELKENETLKAKVDAIREDLTQKQSMESDLKVDQSRITEKIEAIKIQRLSVEDQINSKIPRLIRMRNELKQLQSLETQSREQREIFQENDEQLRFRLQTLKNTLPSPTKESYLTHLKYIILLALLVTYINIQI